ncbi:substrate-binding domain-containing protein [Streptosporangium lutulentum]
MGSRTCSAQGYDQIISNTDGERRLEQAAIEQMIARQVDGLAFAVFHTHPEDLLPAIEAGISVVRLGGRLAQDGVDVVHSDDEGGSAEATRYLLERGYRRVGFVCGPHAEGPAAERVAGYRSALRAAGMADDPGLVAHTHFSRAGGPRAPRVCSTCPSLRTRCCAPTTSWPSARSTRPTRGDCAFPRTWRSWGSTT